MRLHLTPTHKIKSRGLPQFTSAAHRIGAILILIAIGAGISMSFARFPADRRRSPTATPTPTATLEQSPPPH
jgi:hypothetical protein